MNMNFETHLHDKSYECNCVDCNLSEEEIRMLIDDALDDKNIQLFHYYASKLNDLLGKGEKT